MFSMATTTKQAGRKRWKGVSPQRRKELMKTASRKYWDSLSPEERSAEMKRRAKVRNQNRARKAKSS